MSNFDVDIEIKMDGGIFDGASRAIDRAENRVVEEVGAEGTKMVTQRLDKVLVNPTGHYRSRIDFALRSDDLGEVHDSDVVYGPWLESGRGGTRFRGYSTFRKVAQELETRADGLLVSVEDQLAKELG